MAEICTGSSVAAAGFSGDSSGTTSASGSGTGARFDQSQSLNQDPYNLRAEELAVAECARGVEVRRTWSEQEMVRYTLGGQMSPGTPDGMFESWAGELTCVQVVRVPVIAGMTPSQMQKTLAQIVLTKVLKSQQWLRACSVSPNDFVIFCWLPFGLPDDIATATYELMLRVQKLDPRFSLRLRVPTEPGALFPSKFASHIGEHYEKRVRTLSVTDLTTFAATGTDTNSEDEEFDWDIWDAS
mmetsp:Transcript_78673/g.217525  ORF Transcript_78673/g.217525 Transcript_78673/m.217525 type:complete len:241 (+) Transcript_78673:99-821(+)